MKHDLDRRQLSARFDRALTFAVQLHASQFRKASGVPYIAHLLVVAGTVLDVGGTEDEAIAALLHDAVEDQGGEQTRARIHALFGDTVTAIVDGCTEIQAVPKPRWKIRKNAYLAHLRRADASVRLVALADKLHNARSTLRDYQRYGEEVWSRFSSGRDEQLWWYDELVEIFGETDTAPQLVAELRDVVAALHQ